MFMSGTGCAAAGAAIPEAEAPDWADRSKAGLDRGTAGAAVAESAAEVGEPVRCGSSALPAAKAAPKTGCREEGAAAAADDDAAVAEEMDDADDDDDDDEVVAVVVTAGPARRFVLADDVCGRGSADFRLRLPAGRSASAALRSTTTSSSAVVGYGHSQSPFIDDMML